MTFPRGQTLRRIGLVIEALCMLGLVGLAQGRLKIWKGFPVNPQVFLSVGLGIGFLLWIVGTTTIYAGRKTVDRQSPLDK